MKKNNESEFRIRNETDEIYTLTEKERKLTIEILKPRLKEWGKPTRVPNPSGEMYSRVAIVGVEWVFT